MNVPTDFYDMHSHILWSRDDGAKTLQEALAITRKIANNGFGHIVATPHIMEGVYENKPESILLQIEELKTLLQQESLDISVYAAAEYNFDPSFYEAYKKGDLLTYGNAGRYFLVEIPMIRDFKLVEDMIFECKLRGYTPIIAHPERYSTIKNKTFNPVELVSRGALLQMNLGSLSDFYGPTSRKIAEQLLKEHLISFVGSDSHGYEGESEYHRHALEILRKKVSQDYFDELLVKNPKACLSGEFLESD